MFKYEDIFSRHISHLRITASGQAYGRCPWHDDKASSFSCHLSTGFWSCHAGCGSGNIVTFGRRIGSSTPALQESRPSPGLISSPPVGCATTSAERKKIVATYQYKYEDGSDAYQVIRFDPKGFAQRRRENGQWVWGTTGIRRVPYNLPSVMRSSKIILVEGEKDADRLNSLNLVATTTPMGASSWDVAYGSFFKSKQVAIIPDNDLPGKKYAADAARDITASGGVVRVVELPGLPEKGDVSDWLDTGGNTLAALLDLIRNAPVQKPSVINTEPPLKYFAGQHVVMPDGKGALPGEYQVLCREAFSILLGCAQNCNERAMSLLDELEMIWRTCSTERRFSQFMWKLKEIHIASLA